MRNHLELHSYRVSLEQKVLARTREATLLKDITILAMGELAEHRDANTGGHINRTRFFVKTLAETLFDKKKFPDILTQEYIVLLYKTAPLHDIGKVAIRDSILLKKGRLTAEEFAEMKKHTIYGEEVIDKLAKMAGEPMLFWNAPEIWWAVIMKNMTVPVIPEGWPVIIFLWQAGLWPWQMSMTP
ncbi:HD domain-containing protein [Desulfobulbus sp. US1]|nr:HD domain-containing protein [Desulfobulbus sp. US1]